ncbi:MAG TPA: 4-hydroxy-tetrahydrodipicolinate reductase [Blastocatellia bacterium]|nr:4-hydroxy-tetrahydrodipicolinate reductase [Blastocatellia bacterium]
MRIALIGYGKMGQEIARAAADAGIEVGAIFTSRNNASGQGLTADALREIDVCLDFSTPQTVFTHLRALAQVGKPVVVGTTGWYDRLDEARQVVEHAGIGCVYAPNFSIGVNLFYRLIAQACRLFSPYPDFDPYVVEYHHRAKADYPSGTALRLADILLENLTAKARAVTRLSGRLADEEIHVASVRGGAEPGRHVVGFDAPYETIEIVHSVRQRRAFAMGALLAARWIRTRRGFYRFDDLLEESLSL